MFTINYIYYPTFTYLYLLFKLICIFVMFAIILFACFVFLSFYYSFPLAFLTVVECFGTSGGSAKSLAFHQSLLFFETHQNKLLSLQHTGQSHGHPDRGRMKGVPRGFPAELQDPICLVSLVSWFWHHELMCLCPPLGTEFLTQCVQWKLNNWSPPNNTWKHDCRGFIKLPQIFSFPNWKW